MFDIDLVRFVLENKLNDTRIPFFSFYEPLIDVEQATRYTENLQAMIREQNNMNDNDAFAILKPSGDIEITNIKTNYISSFSFDINIKTSIDKRTRIVNKFMKLFKKEINGRDFKVVVDENDIEYFYKEPKLDDPLITDYSGCFYGYDKEFGKFTNDYLKANLSVVKDEFYEFLSTEYTNEIDYELTDLYILVENKYIYKTGETFRYIGECELYKVDFNVSSFSCDTPEEFNSEEQINIYASGNATICDDKVILGNDYDYYIALNGGENVLVEPIAMPTGYSVGSVPTQTESNKFVENKIITAINQNFSLSFVVDFTNPIIERFYNIVSNNTGYTFNPNDVYVVTKKIKGFGNEPLRTEINKCKLMKVDLNNTQGDVMMVTCDFVVGDY